MRKRPAAVQPQELLRAAAFRDIHAPRLHAFALLLTLGDEPLASALAVRALTAGAGRTNELRHPERAAAWLRARLLRSLPRRRVAPARTEDARRHVLAELGLPGFAFEGLAALSPPARAALVASAIERLEMRDVETVLGRGPSDTRSLLREARERYLAAALGAIGPEGIESETAGSPASEAGDVTGRVRALAARTLGSSAEVSG